MKRSRIGLLCGAAVLAVAGGLPPVMASAQPTPTPEPTTSAPSSTDHDMLKGVLHGEGLVQTTKGPIRVAMQRGEATKLTPTSLTVQSTDGYTKTWTLNDNVRVYDQRHTLQPDALKAGAQLTVAGTAPATTTASPGNARFTAKWVLVKTPQTSQTS